MVEYILPSNTKTLLRPFCNSNCIHLCSLITLKYNSNVNIVEWCQLSMPAVRLSVGSAIIISFGLACNLEVAPLIGMLLIRFFHKVYGLGFTFGCMFMFRIRVYL